MTFRLLLTLLAILPAHGVTFESTTPILNQSKPFSLPARILDGPFEFEAKLTIPRLNATASSIRFGDQFNFGFDSRSKSLFVEGSIIGPVTALTPTKNHLSAGKPFEFRATRDNTNHFKISINNKTVFETRKLIGPLDHITLRPHRGSFDIHRLRLTGNITVEKEGLSLTRKIVPILIDGTPRTLLDLNLSLDQQRTLKSACIKLAHPSGQSELRNLQLKLRDGPTFGSTETCGPSVTLSGALTLPPGRHHLQLVGSLDENTDLLHQLNPSISWIAFEDGTKITPPPAPLPPLRLAYPIHKRGQHKCHTFRIPGLARANDGSLLAVYDMRYNSSRDLQEHMDIGLSRSTDGGQTWTAPTPIMDMGEFGGKPQKENGCSDPNILVDTSTGEIFVTALWTHGKPNTHQWRGKGSEPGHDIHMSTQFMMVRSTDHGLTWSKPENLTTKLKNPEWYLFAPAPGNGITLHDGTLVIPSQGRDATGLPFSNLIFSKDHGKTWTVSNPARDNTTECSIAQLSDQSLLLNIRDNRNRKDKSATNGRAIAVTRDLGQTWSKHPADHGLLPEPTCMASTISHTLEDGRHVLIFSNPRDKHSRRNMTIQASLDDGLTWPAKHHLLLDSGTGYGYSCLTIIDRNTLGIVYESSQADMTFQKILLSDLIP